MPWQPAELTLRSIVPVGSLAAMLACADVAEQEAGLERLSLVEDLRLDADAEDFSAFNRVSVNHAGRIAIPLRQDFHVRVDCHKVGETEVEARREKGEGRSHLGQSAVLQSQPALHTSCFSLPTSPSRPYAPVLPKPPAPRPEGGSSSTSRNAASSTRATINCPIRMPRVTVNGSAPRFTSATLSSPR